MIRTLIVSGGSINQIFLKDFLSKNEFNIIIASDKGLEALSESNIKPNYIIGDFDSIDLNILKRYEEDKSIKIIKLNPEKDFTDTHMALKLAMQVKSDDITIVGAIGTRIDHTLGNINIIKEAMDQNIPCEIVNENNKVFLINKSTEITKEDTYKYISLIPLTTEVEVIELKGFKYTLKNAKLKIGESIGISNEQLDDVASIKIKNGILIVIKSKD